MTEPTLPYQLTEGVTATQAGIMFSDLASVRILPAMHLHFLDAPYGIASDARVLPWSMATKRLRYQEGEPWVNLVGGNGIYCGTAYVRPSPSSVVLHRVAAILCDDAEAFQVLHWCIHNFGKEQDNE